MYLDEKRVSARVVPIKREMSLSELSICAYLYWVELAKIVCVQFKQISYDWLLFRCDGDYFNSHNGLSHSIFHELFTVG